MGYKIDVGNLVRVKVCFRCRIFVQINEKDPKNLSLLNLFDRLHAEHPRQVVNRTELDNSYREIFDLKQETS